MDKLCDPLHMKSYFIIKWFMYSFYDIYLKLLCNF